MRYLGLIFSVLIAYHTNGQDNNFFQLAGPDNYYPDNFDKTLGVRTVLVKTDCKKCSPPRKQEHTETYLFNAKGLNTERNSIHRGRKWGMRKFSKTKKGDSPTCEVFAGLIDRLSERKFLHIFTAPVVIYKKPLK